MKIEVVILLFNRVEHTKKLFKSLIRNKINKVTAYIDYPLNENDKNQQKQIKKFISNIKNIRIELIERNKSYGLAKNLVSAMNETFDRGNEGIILLEDDCILLDGAKEFFFSGLKNLRTNKKIRSLCGYNCLGNKAIIDPNANLLIMNRFFTWGWATWKDRWKEYEPNLKKIVNKTKKKGINIKNFSEDLQFLTNSKAYLSGSKNIWSISWILLHYVTSTYTIYPPESLVHNIGFDGSGINSIKTKAFNIKISKKRKFQDYKWNALKYFIDNDISVNNFMNENFKKIYPEI